MRNCIEANGGSVLFNKKLTDIVVKNGAATAVVTSDGDTINTNAIVLATGHSARDIF